MRAGEEFRLLVAAVIDQGFMQAAETLRGIARDIFDIERLDDIDHKVGAGRRLRLAPQSGGVPVSAAAICRGRPQRRWPRRGLRTIVAGDVGGIGWQRRTRRARDRHTGQKFASIQSGSR